MKHTEGGEAGELGEVAQEKPPELDRQYGAIGISAVAAAVRYQSEAKNLAYAPAVARYELLSDEIAA